MADEVEIKPGDIVVLLSGSAQMTVGHIATIASVKTATVIWSDNKMEHHTAAYPVAALRKV